MNKFFTLLGFCALTLSVSAQTQPSPNSVNLQTARQTFTEIQPFGKVDIEDLQMKECDFEKDANAEILFTREIVRASPRLEVEVHQRIKIFTQRGTGKANFRIRYQNTGSGSPISKLEAETLNLVNGKIEVTPLDKKVIYITKVDRQISEMSFALPNVKPGSILDVKYLSTQLFDAFYFQSNIPTRYSELEMDYLGRANIKSVAHVKQAYEKNIGKSDDEKQIRAMINVHSLPDEPYMTSERDNWQRIELFNANLLGHSWDLIGKALINFEHFGSEFDQILPGESGILKHARVLNSDDEKIAYIFDTVKNCMKWNSLTNFYAYDAITQAWNKKTGNSAEINLILYNILKRAGINAFPMVISTRDNGKMSPANPNPYAFNNTVVYIPVDTAKFYVLDATDKFNLFNTIPFDDLNSFGLSINARKEKTELIPLSADVPVVQSCFLNAEIKPEGKMTGTVEITSDSYNKIDAVKKYKTDGEEKYISHLLNNNNNIKQVSLKMENMEVDSLPLTQKISFSADLAGSDENYIFFSPNVFPVIKDNPFKSENRFSDIDLGYRDNYSISCIYKLPAGYKTDALPKSITIIMPDQSIAFKRTVAQDNETLLIRYMIDHRKTVFFMEDYQDVRGFYKKMYELLNEQIVLKKG